MIFFNFSGGYIVGVTPVPIPNTEVKPYGADGTAWATVWESRSLPGLTSMKKPGDSFSRLFHFLPLLPTPIRWNHPDSVDETLCF